MARRVYVLCPCCGKEHKLEALKIVRGPATERPSGRPKVRINAADREFSLLIRKRDGHRCQRCGGTTGLQAAHIFTRRRKLTRHDERNAVTLCTGCHMWAHQNPHDFTNWVISWMGQEAYEELRELANTVAGRVKRNAAR